MITHIRHIFILAICLSGLQLSLHGQSSMKPNAIHLELNPVGYSINYERQLLKHIPLNLHVGAGISEFNLDFADFNIPLGLRYYFPIRQSGFFIDLDTGVTYAKAIRAPVYMCYVGNEDLLDKFDTHLVYNASIGLNYLVKDRFSLRAGTGIYWIYSEPLPSLELGIGTRF